MYARSSSRLARGLALALILVLPTGCDKGGGGTEQPGGDGHKANKVEGHEFAYADTFAITGDVTIDFGVDSPEGKGATKVVAKTTLEGSPASGKIKTHGKITELVEYTGSGALDFEFQKQQAAKAGQEGFDPVAELKGVDSWAIVDPHGEADAEATKALSENAGKPPVNDFGLFDLPELPTVPLEVGKETELPTEATEENVFGQMVPSEIDRKWTLVSMGDEGGRKVARFKVHVESSGALDIEGRGSMSYGEESDYEFGFDLDARVPIEVTGATLIEFSVDFGPGQSGSAQFEHKVKATYTAAAG